jgi:hypothetical protein
MLHDPFAQKVVCSHFALTVLFQSDSIGLSHRRARRARATFPFYAARMKDSARMSACSIIIINYGARMLVSIQRLSTSICGRSQSITEVFRWS